MLPLKFSIQRGKKLAQDDFIANYNQFFELCYRVILIYFDPFFFSFSARTLKALKPSIFALRSSYYFSTGVVEPSSSLRSPPVIC